VVPFITKQRLIALAAALMSVGTADAASVDATRIANADREPDQWLSVGRTYDEQRFSPLARIDTGNISKLGLAWFADLDTNRGQEATPLVIDGVMYFSTAWSKVKAYEAVSGKLLWAYDPKVPAETAGRGCCDVVNRGLAAWKGKIFVGSYDGRLIALDAKNGTVVWDVNTVDRTQAYTITGAPRVVKGRVLIGNGGAEFGVRGYISAYDAETGKMAWRWYTIPGNPAEGFENAQMREAAKTWNGEWWKIGGGGTVWDSMAYDPKLDLLYVGVGNGSPWNQRYRGSGGGDNLFLASIVALDPDDGSYRWHYQTAPGETWDYTATQHIIVADLTIDGRKRRVVMQAPKNGFFYVLDAKTGKLISAKNYVQVNWATGIDLETGRPIPVAKARFDQHGEAAIVQPGPQGAHAWHPMSFSPKTGLVYLPAVDNSMIMKSDPNFVARQMAANTGLAFPVSPTLYDELKSDAPREARAQMLAWDPVKQREVWRTPVLGRVGSGILSTAGGLVFQGTPLGDFHAYRATDGERLWSFKAQVGVVAAPASFEIAGEQYIVVLAGYGVVAYGTSNLSRALVFKLGGTAELPPAPAPPPPPVLNPPPATASAETVARGRELFNARCLMCHEPPAANRGVFPDLRYSPMIGSAEAFRSVVIDGALEPRGMASFRSLITAEDAESIRAYMISRAHSLKAGIPTRP
jgi:quinohemoprotein ethanol dehydrogenase